MGAGELRGVEIAGNVADDGGGLSVYGSGSLTLRDVEILDNTATNGGGGMFAANTSPSLVDVKFVGNQTPGDGGGLLVERGSTALVGAYFCGNDAANGGAISAGNGAYLSIANASVTGNTAVNDGGALFCPQGECYVANSSFSDNSAYRGGAIAVADTLDVFNAILWGNLAAESATNEAFVGPTATASIGHSTVSGSSLPNGFTDRGGNNHLDPHFVDPDGPDDTVGTEDDNLRLQHSSPIIDTGSNGHLPSDELDVDGDGDTAEFLPIDLDGNPRVIAWIGDEPIVDRGAYEAERPLAVEFTSARAVADGSSVTVLWSIRDNSDVQSFAIESLVDGSLSPVVQFDARPAHHEYSYTLTSVPPGEHRFRIRAVHMDGTSTYSADIVIMMRLFEAAVALSEPWPNPAADYATIQLTVAKRQSVTAQLIDLLGRTRSVVFGGLVEADRPVIIRVETGSLPAGLYMIQVRGATFTHDRRLVVVH
jgi:predicted outer membrane repeat protein